MPKLKQKVISLDSEATGVDLHHGAQPFFVSIFEKGEEDPWFWSWEVDYITRKVQVVESDVKTIQKFIDEADLIIGQNLKFDIRALSVIGVQWTKEHWKKVRDTLIGGHLLNSSVPHDLTSMVKSALRIDISSYEEALRQAIKDARAVAKKELPDWRIAKEGLPEMPSASGSAVGFDYALPRAVALALNYPEDHPWHTVLRDYGCVDPVVTMGLWEYQEEKLRFKGLLPIFYERMKLPPIISKMEETGITINGEALNRVRTEFSEKCISSERICVNLSGGTMEKLPKGGVSNALKDAINYLGLVSTKKTKKGAESFDKTVMDTWLATYPERSREYKFVEHLKYHRSGSRAIGDMNGYETAWLPVPGLPGWWRLHPSLNPTGTVTLRFSSNNPNEQNISKKEGFNLRQLYCPLPGYEWWSFDYSNLELRIPAYEAGETEMIKLFEAPKEPPFYGSYHMLIFETLHPEKFAKHGMECKTIYESTWYQWTKNGNFAVQYGAQEISGTADRAYHIPGAQKRIKSRFTKISQLNDKMVNFAELHGYVETIPDRTVGKRGYPLYCARTPYGKILATVPLAYHVQGTAMWIAMRAMFKVQELLDTQPDGFDMIMQVHDEIVCSFPQGQTKTHKDNIELARKVASLMASVGDDVGIPLGVSMKYHDKNWSEGETVK